MKFPVNLFASLATLLLVAGCAGAGRVHEASPIRTVQPFDLDLIWVKTASTLPGLEPEQRRLNDAIVSGLRETRLFRVVSSDQAELGEGSGVLVKAEIRAIRAITQNQRLWAGAMAGRARLRVQVEVSELHSGQVLETFIAEGESSSGSALAGTTDEAIERVADAVVGEMRKINVRTAP